MILILDSEFSVEKENEDTARQAVLSLSTGDDDMNQVSSIAASHTMLNAAGNFMAFGTTFYKHTTTIDLRIPIVVLLFCVNTIRDVIAAEGGSDEPRS